MAEKLDIDRVKSLFLLFSDLDDIVAQKWEVLCENAARGIERRLLPKVNVSASSDELCAAAAGCAYAEYLFLQDSTLSDVNEMRVGDISLKTGSAQSMRQDATELRDHFMAEIAHLLRVESPVFIIADGVEEDAG